MAYGVIMAGGSGTRFWPKSRRLLPKQLMKLTGDRTMLQLAVDRLSELIEPQSIYVITNAELAAQARDQLPNVPASGIIGEPVGRDTAACIGLGALLIRKQDPDAVMVVVTADHLIQAADAFRRDFEVAIEVAGAPGVIVTFGIKPNEPATVYGYIERGDLVSEEEGLPGAGPISVYNVNQFREKPSRDVAQQYLDSGRFYWNSGMFVWRAQTILDALARSTPTLYSALTAIEPALGTPEQDEAIAGAYADLEKVSIDYAVMESATNVRVVEATFDGDDVGSGLSMERLHEPDEAGNTVLAQHVGIDTRNCVLSAEPGHLLATIGVDDLVVVHTPDATLVCTKDRVDEIKKVVQALEQGEDGLDQYL